jgi:hypothetical protein
MKSLTLACLAMFLVAQPSPAQPPTPPPDSPVFYRLDLVIKENEGGKVINSRNYSMEIAVDPPRGGGPGSSIRTGSRVPIPGKDSGITYIELGINFDCRSAKEVGNQLSLFISVDVSSVAEPASTPPIIRNTKWASTVLIPVRKPTVIFSSDDAMSKRQMQLEITATLLK